MRFWMHLGRGGGGNGSSWSRTEFVVMPELRHSHRLASCLRYPTSGLFTLASVGQGGGGHSRSWKPQGTAAQRPLSVEGQESPLWENSGNQRPACDSLPSRRRVAPWLCDTKPRSWGPRPSRQGGQGAEGLSAPELPPHRRPLPHQVRRPPGSGPTGAGDAGESTSSGRPPGCSQHLMPTASLLLPSFSKREDL